MNAKQQVELFRQEFAAAGTRERAEGEKAYLKSELDFHGVAVPLIRKAAKQFCKQHPELTRDELVALVEALWRTSYHDLRTLGIAILELYAGLLKVGDMKLLERLIQKAANWAHVDFLAAKVAGALVARYVSANKVLSRWAKHDDLWLRRSALIAPLDLLRNEGGDFEQFARFAEPMLVEKEFFVRKAIGWVLREVSKKRPQLSYAFLREHLTGMSGLTFREGSKHLPAKMKAELEKRRKVG